MARKNKKNPAPSSRTPSLSNKSAGTLWGKLAENVSSYVVSFVLGAMIIGAFNYLLLQAKAEELALEREMLHFSAFAKEDESANEMAEFWKSDGSSKSEPVTKIQAVVKRLSDSITTERLDDAFVRETSIEISASISHIATQIGRINGYTFGDELYKSLQQDFVKELDAEKNLLFEVTEIVNNWNKLSVERRRERLGQIFNKGLEVKTGLAQIESRSLQVLKKLTEKMAENRQKYNEIKNQITTGARKKLLAKTGISIGIALILTTIAIYLFKRLK